MHPQPHRDPHLLYSSTDNVGYYRERLEILWWKGVKGTANLLYPHPKSWTFKEIETGTPLDLLEIKDLTGAIGAGDKGEPSCKTNWTNRASSWHILADVDWDEYGRSYTSRLTTNNDIWAHFKNILHRRLVVRAHCPSETGSNRCRCCGDARETHTHLVRCRVLWEVLKVFRRLSRVFGTPSPTVVDVAHLDSAGARGEPSDATVMFTPMLVGGPTKAPPYLTGYWLTGADITVST